MTKAYMAAVLLALALVAAVIVPVAVSPAAFGFGVTPAAPSDPPRDHAVVVETDVPSVPVATGDGAPAERAATSAPQPLASTRREPAQFEAPRASAGSPQAPSTRRRVTPAPQQPAAQEPPAARESAPAGHSQQPAPQQGSDVVAQVVGATPALPVPHSDLEARPATPALPVAPPDVSPPDTEDGDGNPARTDANPDDMN